MEWIQSALFLYAAHQEHLGEDLHQAIWAYTAAMIDKLEEILTEAKYIVNSGDIVEEYRWAAKQLRVAIARHLNLIKMFEHKDDVTVPPVSEAGKRIAQKVHGPKPNETQAAVEYLQGEFRKGHPGYDAVLPKDLGRYCGKS